jgi:putative hydrolase of the HAD superfamily
MLIKIVSFDLDGTLISSNLDNLIWDVLIPQIYAKKKGLLLSEAQKFFAEEYMKDLTELKVEAKDWFSVDWWIKKYELDTNWEELWQKAQSSILVYDDVEENLKKLKSLGYKIIITTGASQSFIDVKLKNTNFKDLFDEIISVPDKYNTHDKGSDVYEKICEDNNIKPLELLHVGDSYMQDVQAPKSVGCQALFLNRNEKIKSFETITSLKQVVDFVNNQPE